jgi:hypothetical protein
VSWPVAAQVQTFELGTLREDVHASFGAPERFFAPQPQKYLFGLEEYLAASRVWTRIDDVFMRETPTNLYRVHVQYHADSRQSRLRPKERVGRIELTVDQPGNYRETLDELPEAKSICKGGCLVYGWHDPHGYIHEYYVLAHPANPSAELLRLGNQVASGFDESEAADIWSIGISLKFVEPVFDSSLSLPDPSPINWYAKIGEIEIAPIKMESMTRAFQWEPLALSPRRSRRYRERWPHELGMWQPR